jgi:dihydroxyacid dehydratase/phosphogluconate dehydratase
MDYDMPQREAVLNAAEASLNITWCDGWVGIGSAIKSFRVSFWLPFA